MLLPQHHTLSELANCMYSLFSEVACSINPLELLNNFQESTNIYFYEKFVSLVVNILCETKIGS